MLAKANTQKITRNMQAESWHLSRLCIVVVGMLSRFLKTWTKPGYAEKIGRISRRLGAVEKLVSKRHVFIFSRQWEKRGPVKHFPHLSL